MLVVDVKVEIGQKCQAIPNFLPTNSIESSQCRGTTPLASSYTCPSS